MNIFLAVAAGGALGSVLRHSLMGALNAAFPYGTLVVNVVGSFAIGALMELFALKWNLPIAAQAFLITGFLGGFTTFSAFSFDVLKLVDTGQAAMAALYVLLCVGLSLLAVFGGVFLIRGVS